MAWFMRRLVRLGVLCGGGALLGMGGYALWVARDLPSPETFGERQVIESTKIYDRTGEVLLYEIHGEERRTLIPENQIPETIKHAVVVVEDERFYSHPGVDVRGIARSIYANITNRRIAQGGSTITQQLIRNTLITRERTLARKIKEAILALELELRYSKDELLAFWLNTVPFGENAYGVEAAAQTYFGKSVRNLSLNEAAVLAALPKAPSYYSPYGSNADELENRKNLVLERMAQAGYITSKQYKETEGALPEFLPPSRGILAPHFTLFVRDYLEKRYGKETISQQGLKIYTTLDWELQQRAEEIVREGVTKNEKSFNASNASLVAINPTTGEVLAMVGSRDYFDLEHDGNVNVALRPRQPGSAFKPIAYAAAFEQGYTPDTIVFDLKTEFAKGGVESYAPRNYDGRYRGPVTLKQALANSINVPAVKTLYLAGLGNTIDLAETLGITTLSDRSRYGLALVLGGGEVKLFELVSAFGVFATEGERFSATPIRVVLDSQGNVIEEFQPQGIRVLDKNTARIMNDILSDNDARSWVFGTRSALVVPGHQVAAKTGTTQDYRDAWTVGYTPSLVVGVWAGNNDNSEMKKGSAGVYVAAPIWKTFMKEVLAEHKKEWFRSPVIERAGKTILDGNPVVENLVSIDTASEKRATEKTPVEFIVQKAYVSVHSILFWVDRKNPLGEAPAFPSRDPQFANWEASVEKWLLDHPDVLWGKETTPPPKEFDDVHIEENEPVVYITEPLSGEIITNTSLLVKFVVTSRFDIKNASFFVDDYILKTVSDVARNTPTKIPLSVAAKEGVTLLGEHRLTLRVFDVFGNVGSASVVIQFE